MENENKSCWRIQAKKVQQKDISDDLKETNSDSSVNKEVNSSSIHEFIYSAYNCLDCGIQATSLCKPCVTLCHKDHQLQNLGSITAPCECSIACDCKIIEDDYTSPSISLAPGKRHTKWTGYYKLFGAEHPVCYEDVVFDGPDFSGKGKDDVGAFILKGKVKDNGDVNFLKSYIGAHAVDYLGNLQQDQSIKGRWKIHGEKSIKWSDEFYIKIEDIEDVYEAED